MLDMKWRYVHLLFFFSFIGSWMAFAIIWKVSIYQNILNLFDKRVFTSGISSFIIMETLKKIIYLTTRREQVRIVMLQLSSFISIFWICQAGLPVFGR